MGAGSGQPATRGDVELADIFRDYGESYRRTHPLPVSHLKVMQAVERCRTKALGGHLQQCDACGYERPAYNSCRNRHCPKCQSLAQVKWVDKQKSELLPTGYFHLVFTLPHPLNSLILVNKKLLINILFQSSGRPWCSLLGAVWVEAWGLPRFCTPGTRPCWIIFICTVWFLRAHCRWIEPVGFRRVRTFFSRLKP